ncbi:GAK system ATP-grasp enzyme [Spongiibacter sp. KMU-158]|uniref:GAK system ATP-grasp enzyme n=1 Tax=Spongiibacter pelagi TaxID=2760804 RepID=A0A927C0D5_9GAMM|nr:GAK system ATP-grasp enzyme [Spongiibacter pelagi]MBD2857481.1 GAK system ATP-grasp enzyme [Spongiibacter pelagi]
MAKPKIGIIGLPGKWSTETLADAIEQRTGFRLIIDMAKVKLDIASGKLLFGQHDLCALDGLIIKKISSKYSPGCLDRLELLRIAEKAGVRIFSRAENVLRLIDRLSCTVTLANAGIPMPDTIVTESPEAALDAVQQYGSAVFKPLFSTKARGMCILDASLKSGELRNAIAEFQQDNPMMYIQRKLALPGQDMGLVFLGGEYMGSYARVPKGDSWNTTIHSGGHYAACSPPQSTIDMAHRAQAAFGLDFTTVDVADTDNGPIVFEVSAFGGFRGAKEGANFDAASAYADYALRELQS